MTKFQNKEQVQTVREEGIKGVFNRIDLSVALVALKSTPAVSKRSGGCGGGKKGIFMTNLEDCIKAAKDNGTVQITMNQIQAMMKTSLSSPFASDDEEKSFNKKVSDKVWGLSDKNKKNDAPILHGVSNGIYEIL